MSPEALSSRLRSLADQIDRKDSPSRVAVVKQLLKMALEIQDQPSIGRTPVPTFSTVDVSDDRAFREALAAVDHGMPDL